MTKITKNMMIADVLAVDAGLAQYFLEIGMHCLGCPSARAESVEDACSVHNVDVNGLLDKLNKHLEA